MSHEELEACIKEHGKDIYSFCCQLTGSRQEADDLYQDTFLKMVELLERLDIKSNPKSYLLSVAVNLWRNRKRKFAVRQRITGPVQSMEEMELQLPAGERSPEEQIISGEETRQIRKAVGRLPEKYRLPVLLFYMEDLKLSEISGVLKVPEGTVKSRLFKAKKLLRKELEVVLNEKKF
ncbi:MAG: RNA polymerase sigma factor [Lachnospiraceae bacterium]|nr:RNA polymerase sigma factor [Lachnospiraceae bacterium]